MNNWKLSAALCLIVAGGVAVAVILGWVFA